MSQEQNLSCVQNYNYDLLHCTDVTLSQLQGHGKGDQNI